MEFKETFYLDGIDAEEYGIRLQRPIEFEDAMPIVETVHVPGRNGDLVFSTGAYSNRRAIANCFVLSHNHAKDELSRAAKFLFSSVDYRKFEVSDDPEHFLFARVASGAKINNRLRSLCDFSVEFDCKPQRFLKSGLYPVSYDEAGTLVNFNSEEAKPIITVWGNGSGRLQVGENVVEIIDFDGSIILDCDLQNAYNGIENMNRNISAAKFPILKAGENAISFSGGISKVEIIPRWWEL